MVGPDVAGREMRPARPNWLENTDAINRSVLFERLEGFFTLGSPLDKFATLWPAIVPINKDIEALAGCDWINVHDRMDPVAAQLDRFGKEFSPSNIPYKASNWFIFAHIRYLRRTTEDGFAARLGEWSMAGKPFNEKISGKFGGGDARTAAKCVWWIGLSGLASFPLIWLVQKMCGNCAEPGYRLLTSLLSGALKTVFDSSYPFAVLCVVGTAVILVLVAALACGKDNR